MRVRFGECTLDTGTRELQRAGAAVHLAGKAFRLLEVLIENRPKALSKDELHELVWPGVFVSEANLTTLVMELRKLIGDDAREPAFIRTVYGFGYAFTENAEEIAAPPTGKRAVASRFRLFRGRREIPLLQGENILGRGPDAIERLDRETVSRCHARIVVDGDKAALEDMGSKNGTFLRGRRLTSPAGLVDGDQIKLGSVKMTFRVLPEGPSTATASRALK